MSEGISQQISLLCSLIQTRRFDDGTLRILESVLISRDVQSLLDVRRSLRDFMRHESRCALREIHEKSVDHKLLILGFFVRAFAITGDLERSLALRYEALVLRELHSVGDLHLHVLYEEWLTFAEHAFENRFYAIAKKACEKALALAEDMESIRKIKKLKDNATVRTSSQSVQAQAVDYLKRKVTEHDKVSTSVAKEKQHSGSILFRNGIKKHNTRKLQQLQRL